MTKKDLEDIIQTAKAAGANVKVVQVGSAENEPVERPKIPLFKLEVGIKKEGDELNNYIQEQYKGALEDEKERIRRKSC